MHRALTVALVLAVVAGSVPAAASLADGTPSNSEPGASFAGVVGVQGAEVDNEVANRSLDKQLRAAQSNRSKAAVVAGESQQLETRLVELEAEKERLNAAYENGSISKGKYKAQLAVVAAELRSLERRANHTAEAAEKLPPEALEEAGANVSQVREIARDANRSGGGEVAQAARDIAGNGVGNGLGASPSDAGPPNGTETGPPENVGEPARPNASDRPGSGTVGPPSSSGNGSTDASDRSGNGNNPATAVNRSNSGNADGNATNRTAPETGGANGNGNANASENRSNSSPKTGGAASNRSNASTNASSQIAVPSWQGNGERRNVVGERNETATDTESMTRVVFSPAADA